MEFKILLGNNIKELRLNLKLNQEEFCNNLNIAFDRANLSRIESGKQMPSAEFIKSIIECYNVSPYWLLDINNISDESINDKYNLLSNKDKDNLDNYIDFLIKQNSSNLYTSTDIEVGEGNKKSS